ncbi:hypothetical protein C8Q75DRAFT_733684 [Abortiporus biennis]|nr:hypothetical protein C8Q75DRAFT_733684 [Abortiporus biennis]
MHDMIHDVNPDLSLVGRVHFWGYLGNMCVTSWGHAVLKCSKCINDNLCLRERTGKDDPNYELSFQSLFRTKSREVGTGDAPVVGTGGDVKDLLTIAYISASAQHQTTKKEAVELRVGHFFLLQIAASFTRLFRSYSLIYSLFNSASLHQQVWTPPTSRKLVASPSIIHQSVTEDTGRETRHTYIKVFNADTVGVALAELSTGDLYYKVRADGTKGSDYRWFLSEEV